MELDKDILIKHNRIYSPKTAIFVPHEINYVFINKRNYRGNFPLGVCFNKDYHRFLASCSIKLSDGNQTRIHLGYYANPYDAFNVYKIFKENHIKEIANKFKEEIPQKLYDAMMNYQVEITD